MLTIVIPKRELYNEVTNEFISTDQVTLTLEHSLVSISKWESKWKKPFLDNKPKSREELIDYIRCMTITQNVNSSVYNALTVDNITAINKYIEDPMTATWFREDQQRGPASKEVITSELIYYWMTAYNIPYQFEKWHLNRLLTLIRICGIKNAPPKKMSKKDTMRQNRSLNAARRRSSHSRG